MASPLPKQQIIKWDPQRGPQFAYFKSTAFELLFGGAAGGSKSASLIFDAITLCVKYPKYKAILFRRTFPEIERSLVPTVSGVLAGFAKSRNQGMEWTFPNGSQLLLAHLQREDDKEKHKSAEYDFIGFDELTSFTLDQYLYLFSRCRGTQQVERFVRSASNPSGPGHGWVHERFLQPTLTPEGTLKDVEVIHNEPYEFAYGWRVGINVYTNFSDLPDDFAKGNPVFEERTYPIYKEKKSGLTRAFLPSLLWGNSVLLKSDPEYVKRLKTLDEKTQAALLYGNWDVFEGQFFHEWDPAIHVVDPFPIPSSWKKVVAIDYGFSAPFACGFFAIDNDGNVYLYREIYQSKLTTEMQAKEILDRIEDGEHIEWFTADPSMFSKQGTGESHAQVYHRHGVPIIPSSNKRIPGWALVHEYLMGKKLKVFRTCSNFIRTIPTLVHSKTNPEDLDSTQEDHILDATRYCLLTLRGYKTHSPTSQGDEDVPQWFKERMAMKPNNKRIARIRL